MRGISGRQRGVGERNPPTTKRDFGVVGSRCLVAFLGFGGFETRVSAVALVAMADQALGLSAKWVIDFQLLCGKC